MSQIEQEYKEVQANLKQVNDDLKRYAENSEKEIKNHAQMSEETRAKVDELLVQQGELQANLQSAEQVIAKLEQGGGMPSRPKSAGELVAESEEFQAFSGRGSFKVGVQAAVTSDAASAGDLIEPQRVPGIIAPPNQRLFLRDLLNWGRTTSNSIEYVKETGFTNSADVVSENPTDPKPESDLQFDLES
ncbi:MAG TPA: phage major capsid protein, partial [Arenicellales bacterium]|nr:phage major capsid protein [Arenicellales bacterium]